MKINETQRIGAIQLYKRSQEDKSMSGTSRQSRRDEVKISSEGLELLNGKVDRERIESLKQSVMSGTYHVESNKIAEKLLPFIR